MNGSAALLGIRHASGGVDLFPGSPAAIYADADALTRRAEDLEECADRLRRVEVGQWSGAAADAFAEASDNTRRSILSTADAHTAAASALRIHADLLAWAQGVGDGLVDQWRQADSLADAGEASKRAIDLAADEVRGQVRASGQRLAQALRALNEAVPSPPTFWSELAGGVGDTLNGLWLLVRQQNSIRKIVDPGGWARDTAAMVTGFRDSLNDPKQFAKDSVDWDTWASSPPRAAGRLAPDALTNVLTGGVGGFLGKAATTAARRGADEAADAAGAAGRAVRRASFGEASTANYRKTFFEAYPDLEGEVVVHHAVEQRVLKVYPELVTPAQIHSLENLRGIPRSINSELHLSEVRVLWNQFYKQFPLGTQPSVDQLLDYATSIDQQLGHQFLPPVE